MPANPETSTPTTAPSGPTSSEDAPAVPGANYTALGCQGTGDYCGCWPTGRGLVWSEVMKEKSER